jgi:pilus assembly protein Flp/PilA
VTRGAPGTRWLRRVVARRTDERGASSVEYGLIAVAIAALVVGVVFAFGGATRSLFSASCDTIEATVQTGSDCTR